MSSASYHVECIVIGAGVVGLAVARAFSVIAGKEVLLLDRGKHIGSETSSRNSEVIHAGLYYPSGSAKAQFCVRGKQLLYEFCRERSIDVNNCGKLIVATTFDQAQTILPGLQQKAIANGVLDTQLLSPEDVQVMEPEILSHGALWSPSTGIVDSHNFMYSLLAEAEQGNPSYPNATTTVALQSQVTDARIVQSNGKPCVHVHVDGEWISADYVVNSAGLWADSIARMIHQPDATTDECGSWEPPRQFFAKGTYFRLQGRSPFSHLIYPVPDDKRGGLGVHATIDLHGQDTKFGPDVEWLDVDLQDPNLIDYTADPRRGESFYDAIRQYWPALPDGSLVADYTGVRPKLSHPSIANPMPVQDFAILDKSTHGVTGLVHLLGIESPGLTSSMAIAEYVLKCLGFKQ